MPMWTVYIPEGKFSFDDRQAIATRITDHYAKVMGFPRFWVSVAFHEQPLGGLFQGGEPADNFVRIWIDHAIRRGSPEQYERFLTGMWEALGEWIRDRGFELEVHGDETPIAFWQIDGITPPRDPQSEDWKRWQLENKASALLGK
ncbi:Putative oxalocrotonate tautomerase enzyme [Kutzneria sp. CA-103260]|nr:Putative oxalocrotonate tautomerase enzyme [Kutzneria sp. CA-103260]